MPPASTRSRHGIEGGPCLALGWRRRCRPGPAGRTAGRGGRPAPPQRSRRSRCPTRSASPDRPSFGSSLAMRLATSSRSGPAGAEAPNPGRLTSQTRRSAARRGAMRSKAVRSDNSECSSTRSRPWPHLHDVERSRASRSRKSIGGARWAVTLSRRADKGRGPQKTAKENASGRNQWRPR